MIGVEGLKEAMKAFCQKTLFQTVNWLVCKLTLIPHIIEQTITFISTQL